MIDGIQVFAVRCSQLQEVVAGIRASHQFNVDVEVDDHLNYTAHTLNIHKVLEGIIEESFAKHPRRKELTLLDVGGGRGELAQLFAHRFKTAMIDVDLFSAQVAMKIQQNSDTYTVLCGDCSLLPIAAHSVDVVIVKETAHHMADMESFIREVGRVVRPDGLVLVVEPVLRFFTNRRRVDERDPLRQMGATHHHFLLREVTGVLSKLFGETRVEWAKSNIFSLVFSRLGLPKLGRAIERVWDKFPRMFRVASLAVGGGTGVIACWRPLPDLGIVQPQAESFADYPIELADVNSMPDSAIEGIQTLLLSSNRMRRSDEPDGVPPRTNG